MARKYKLPVWLDHEVEISEELFEQIMSRGYICAWAGCTTAFEGFDYRVPTDCSLVLLRPERPLEDTHPARAVGITREHFTYPVVLCPEHTRILGSLLRSTWPVDDEDPDD